MKKEKPLLFSTEMVRAILDGRKTQTRRVVKFKKEITDTEIGFSAFTDSGEFEVRGTHANGEYGCSFFKMPYQVGDVLWVRETYNYFNSSKISKEYLYKADGNDPLMKWKPSIFMPKEACRIKLQITKIKIERIQNITDKDAKAEGATEGIKVDAMKIFKGLGDWKIPSPFGSYNLGFLELWCRINGCDSWLHNPYVWVIEFKVIKGGSND